MVVIDVEKTLVNLFELTCPSEENINLKNQEKSRKYSHFLNDIRTYRILAISRQFWAYFGLFLTI